VAVYNALGGRACVRLAATSWTRPPPYTACEKLLRAYSAPPKVNDYGGAVP